MPRSSKYRWIMVFSAVCGLSVAASAAGCAAASTPHTAMQTGVRISGAQQSRVVTGERHRAARVENPADFLKLGRPPTSGAARLEEWLAPGDRPLEYSGLCPSDMASIDDRYCIDRYEGSLIELLPNGDERPFDQNNNVEGHVCRAVSRAGVLPQGYISGVQAASACKRSGKRLCSPTEWRRACKGPQHLVYGYSNDVEKNRCNDSGRSPMAVRFGLGGSPAEAYKWTVQKMNDPALNQIPGTLAPTGAHPKCTNGYGVYDMVGNLHEWVADPEGTFYGGYYLDTHQNGDGCDYSTYGHAVWYHDYSTGFRCCADVAQ